MQSPPPCRGAGSNRRATPRMLRQWIAAAWLSGAVLSASSQAETAIAPTDPPNCRSVRLSDIGWTDVTATTAIFSALLKQLGYRAQNHGAVGAGDLRVDEEPATSTSSSATGCRPRRPTASPSSTTARSMSSAPICIGAKYTLAVPAYTYEAGLHDFADIQRFAAQLDSYDLRHRAGQRRQPAGSGDASSRTLYGLGGFKLIESSEQGMLAQVERAIHDQRPIVFLAWDPHPMNMRFDLRYLTGGDAIFGPNFGGATVYTNTRAAATAPSARTWRGC